MSDPQWPSDMQVVSGGEVGDAPPAPATSRRRPRWIAAIWALTVVAAYAIGYSAGHGRPAAAPGPVTSATSSPVLGGQVHWAGASCWQSGPGALIVGMQVENSSPDPAVLTSVDVDVQGAPGAPQIFFGWGDCTSTGTIGPALVPAGQQAWARISIYAPVPCPTALRITFTVTYSLDGHAYTLPVSSPDPAGLACAGR